MNPKTIALLPVGLVFLLLGCARVTFYEDQALTKKTGLRYFEAKPYLLVARKAKEQVDISVVYLPDKTKPQYAVFTPGFGSHEFSLNVGNGILTSYGQKADTKIPELIQALTGTLKEGVATAEKAGVFAAQGAPDYGVLANELDDVGKTFLQAIGDNHLPPAEKALDKVAALQKRLQEAAKSLRVPVPDPAVILPQLKSIRNELEMLIRPVPAERFDPSSDVARYNAVLTIAVRRIDAVSAVIKGDPAPSPAFELYEILQDASGKPSLQKVP